MEAKKLKFILDIQSVLSEIREIKEYVGNNFAVYKSNFIVKRAVERDLEIIGEAVKKLVEHNPNIKITSVKKIISLRNMISHAYDSVDDELIWAIIQRDIPILQDEINNLRKS